MSSTTPSAGAAEVEPGAAARPGLLRSSSLYSLGTLSTLLGGLVRAKVAAVVLGTAGVGLVAQLNNLSTVLGAVTTMGLTNAGVRLIAEARSKNDTEQLRRLVTFLFVVPLMFGAVVLAVGLSLAPELAGAVLKNSHDAAYVAIAVVSVPLNLLIASSYVVLEGSRMFTRLAVLTALTAIGNTVLVIALMLAFRLHGAVAGVLVTSVLGLALVVAREPWLRNQLSWRHAHPGRRALSQFLRLGGASVVVGTLSLVVDTLLRTWLVQDSGLESNGNYQPTYMIAMQLFLPLIGGIAAYLLPTLSATLTEPGDGPRRSVTQAFRLGVLAAVAVSVFLFAFRKLLLVIVFSHSFLPGASPLALQLPGEVLQAGAYVLGTSLLPMDRVRVWASIAIGTLVVQTGVGLAAVGHLGPRGLALAFDAGWLFSVIATASAVRRTPEVFPDGRAWALFATGTAIVSTGALLSLTISQPYPEFAVVAAFALWLTVGLTAEDRGRVRGILAGAAARASAIVRRPNP